MKTEVWLGEVAKGKGCEFCGVRVRRGFLPSRGGARRGRGRVGGAARDRRGPRSASSASRVQPPLPPSAKAQGVVRHRSARLPDSCLALGIDCLLIDLTHRAGDAGDGDAGDGDAGHLLGKLPLDEGLCRCVEPAVVAPVDKPQDEGETRSRLHKGSDASRV